VAAGQAAPRGTLDVGAVDAVEARLAAREDARHAAHADALRDALELHGLYAAAGSGLATPAQLALVWRCSEARAVMLLGAAQLLGELPGAMGLLETAHMTVEQSAVVVRVLEPLDPVVREAVWAKVAARLVADAAAGVQRPPARLSELVRRWVVQVDPAAVERRRLAEQRGDAVFRRREDGLVDLVLAGLTAPDAEACLTRITAGAVPFGVEDSRSAGKRRLDAAVDLLLGRTGRPAAECAGAGAGCGCALGAVPCGAAVTVLAPLATALGAGDVPAELVGHGPVEPDLLAALLAAAPVLRMARVDADGVVVSLGEAVERPGRTDAQGVRAAVRRLLAAPPGPRQPRHPDDHGPPESGPPEGGPPAAGRPEEEPPDDRASGQDPPPPRSSRRRPRVLTRPHPVATAGPYRVPRRLQRFLTVRAPRCEWPGCGARAARCDDEHDLPWPFGPTCGCNLGKLCRRHHRVKQLGWCKSRAAEGVWWTSPTGRQVLAPGQQLDLPCVRPRPEQPLNPLAELSPLGVEQELWAADPSEARFDGLDGPGEGTDRLGSRLRRERAAEERWWVRELAALRRQAFATPHD
jgi:hypothetical protein